MSNLQKIIWHTASKYTILLPDHSCASSIFLTLKCIVMESATQDTSHDYMMQQEKKEGRIMVVIAVVVLTLFFSLLAYLFFGSH